MIDVNVTLGRWPFRRLPWDSTATLAAELKRRGVRQAWAGHFDGVFHRDTSAANDRLAEACHRYREGFLLPFGAANPSAPGWSEDLRRCREVHAMPGIRLHPGYHGYALDSPALRDFLLAATSFRLVVQLSVQLEDERTHHPRMRVPAMPLGPLLPLVDSVPGLRLVLLNHNRQLLPAALRELAATGRLCWDIAMREGVGGVADLAAAVGPGRVLFGSHAPFQYWESAELKLKESAFEPSVTATSSILWEK